MPTEVPAAVNAQEALQNSSVIAITTSQPKERLAYGDNIPEVAERRSLGGSHPLVGSAGSHCVFHSIYQLTFVA